MSVKPGQAQFAESRGAAALDADYRIVPDDVPPSFCAPGNRRYGERRTG
jgi:hypothetical protein